MKERGKKNALCTWNLVFWDKRPVGLLLKHYNVPTISKQKKDM